MSLDRWALWLQERRFGGDPDVRRQFMDNLARTRDAVLDRAELREGETLLDVGCGDGLIAFGALERGAGTVVFSDVSDDLLEMCRTIAADLGVIERCHFVRATAEDLPLDDASVDVVTTRSVLIYVRDKARAFGEFHRVLKPGGRISIWEPINRFGLEERSERGFAGYDADGAEDLAQKLRRVYETLQPPETDPMLDFDERDLLRIAERAGFFPLHLELRADVEPADARRWETFLSQSGNPNIPTVGEAMEQALTPDERERLTRHLRPLVEGGHGIWRLALAHLWGTRR